MSGEPCDRCGRIVAEPVLVREVHSASGGGRNVYACREHAGLYPPEPDILEVLAAAQAARRKRGTM